MRKLSLSFPRNTYQIIAQRYQIAAPWWPNDVSSATDNAIFKNRAQIIECSFGCMARSSVLLKSNIANILLFKFVEHGSLLILEEKWLNYASEPKSAPNSDSFWVRRLFPNDTILLVYIPAKNKMSFI